MSWSPNATFAAQLALGQREEVYAVEISGHSTVFTTGPVTSATWTYAQTLVLGSAESGSVDVARGGWELGELEFAVEDRNGEARALASVYDLAGRTATLWMGFRGLAQEHWEAIGSYTVESAAIEEYGRYRFRCIDAVPQLGRALAGSLGTGNRKRTTEAYWPDDTRLYVSDVDGLEVGQAVVIYDEERSVIRTLADVVEEPVGSTTDFYIVIDAALGTYMASGAEVAPCLALSGNPVNIIMRILLDDFATTGTIQTDFPLTAAYGSWQTGDGFGVPPARIDAAAIKAERDVRLASFDGLVVFERREDDGRAWLNDATHGTLHFITRRDGLVAITSSVIPSAPASPAALTDSVASEWEWQRSWADVANRIIVEGDRLERGGSEIAVVEDSTSITAIGRRELVIRSPWIRTAMNGVQFAETIGGRLLARTTHPFEMISCRAHVSVGAEIEPGDVIVLTHPHMPDTSGGTVMDTVPVEVAASAMEPGGAFVLIEARRYPYARGGAITPDDQEPYADASGTDRATYAFITQDDGKMPDGSPGYTWV